MRQRRDGRQATLRQRRLCNTTHLARCAHLFAGRTCSVGCWLHQRTPGSACISPVLPGANATGRRSWCWRTWLDVKRRATLPLQFTFCPTTSFPVQFLVYATWFVGFSWFGSGLCAGPPARKRGAAGLAGAHCCAVLAAFVRSFFLVLPVVLRAVLLQTGKRRDGSTTLLRLPHTTYHTRTHAHAHARTATAPPPHRAFPALPSTLVPRTTRLQLRTPLHRLLRPSR